MATQSKYQGWQYAPVRFVVWVLAFVLLGRAFYNNSLYDLRKLSAAHVVLRLLSIGITLGFVYWNVFVMPQRITAFVWGMVGLGIMSLLMWRLLVDMQINMADDRDVLQRRQNYEPGESRQTTGRSSYRERMGSVPDGTTADD